MRFHRASAPTKHSPKTMSDAPRREGFWDLGRSVARSVRKHVSTRDEPKARKTRALSEAAGDVLFGALVVGRGENLFRRAIFHQLAQIHERRIVRGARRLLHIVRDDHDSVLGR